MTIDEIVNKLYEMVLNMKDGQEDCVSDMVYRLCGKTYDFSTMVKIENKLRALCKKNKIILDKSAYKDTLCGLPENIPFVKRSK